MSAVCRARRAVSRARSATSWRWRWACRAGLGDGALVAGVGVPLRDPQFVLGGGQGPVDGAWGEPGRPAADPGAKVTG